MKFTRYPKRDAIRDYFPLPNEIFSLGLSTGEIAVYAYLMYCEDRKTFQCHPSYKTIGNAVGMSKNTVKKYVDSLIEKQLITADPTSVITQKGEKRKRGGCLAFPSQGTADGNADRIRVCTAFAIRLRNRNLGVARILTSLI